jgi:hypothetical protein
MTSEVKTMLTEEKRNQWPVRVTTLVSGERVVGRTTTVDYQDCSVVYIDTPMIVLLGERGIMLAPYIHAYEVSEGYAEFQDVFVMRRPIAVAEKFAQEYISAVERVNSRLMQASASDIAALGGGLIARA